MQNQVLADPVEKCRCRIYHAAVHHNSWLLQKRHDHANTCTDTTYYWYIKILGINEYTKLQHFHN